MSALSLDDLVANAGERQDHPDPGSAGLDGVLRALRALAPGPCRTRAAPTCCTWLCSAVVGEVRHGGPTGPPAEPDPEFDEVLVRRLAQRYLRVVTDHVREQLLPGPMRTAAMMADRAA